MIFFFFRGIRRKARGYVDDTIVLVYGACAVEGLPTSVDMSELVISEPPTVLDTKITNCFGHA